MRLKVEFSDKIWNFEQLQAKCSNNKVDIIRQKPKSWGHESKHSDYDTAFASEILLYVQNRILQDIKQ